MYIFCAAINGLLDEMGEKGYKFIAYADDLIIAFLKENEIDGILEFCKDLYGGIGLKINMDKCSSTLNNGTVDFMGVDFSKESYNIPLSEKLKALCMAS